MSTPELACSYAALILADDGIEVTVRLILSHVEFAETLKTRANELSCWRFESRRKETMAKYGFSTMAKDHGSG